MMRHFVGVFVVLCAATVLLGACGPSQEEQLAAQQAADLAALQEAEAALADKRGELAGLEEQLAAVDAEAEDAAEQIVALEADIQRVEGELAAQSDEFNGKVVDFINADPPIEGEPLTETQLAAIRLKSTEDIIVAQEHIEKGGDYKRAIDIFTQSLAIDPDNPDLQAALADAEANRYMTQERFAQVEKGMSPDDVRALLGQANLRNIRDYPDRGVKAWFYPTSDAGEAAAVWFRANKAGDEEVYQAKFEAVKREQQE